MDIVKQSFAYRLESGDNFTISSNLNRIVIIGIYGTLEATNVTYNGQACTRITYGAIGTAHYNSMWYYLPGALAGGAYAIAANPANMIGKANAWEFYNVNQGAPVLDSNYVENETAGTSTLTSNSMIAKAGGYLVSHVVTDTAQSAPYITCEDGSTVDFEGGYIYAAISRALTAGGTATIGVSAFKTSTKRSLASISLNPNKSTGTGTTFLNGFGLL